MLLNNIDKEKPIHFVGIGGTSMSGIAEIVFSMGFQVTGSDANMSTTTERLAKSGIKIINGHHAENVEGSSLVVYTAAIKQDNPELVHAKELGIKCMERAEFLGEITKLYDDTISICGTHGKTTTTSMISLAFLEAGKDPTVQVGAEIRQLNGLNYRVGNSPFFILESCEYVRSFLKFHPKTVVLLNIEEDHLDYYKDLDDIKSAFRDFVSLVPEEGFIVVNSDDSDCMDVVKEAKGKVVTIGIKNKSADFYADNIRINDNGFYVFDVHNRECVFTISLSVPGYHHIYNALSTIATGMSYHIEMEILQKALHEFTGASRRFEYVGQCNGARIFDDYAHHPTEIKATIEAASKMKYHKLWVVFQPHTYSRTKALFDDFIHSFTKADQLVLIDIYAAREPFDETISSKMLADEINKKYNNCIYLPSLEDSEKYLKENLQENDLLLTIGAGTVTKIGYQLINKD